MSKLIALPAQSIPTGILVSAADRPRKPEPPAARREPPAPSRQVPWAWIATGGSIAWVLALSVMALHTMAQEHSLPVPAPVPAIKVAVAPTLDLPAAEPQPGLGIEEAIPDPDLVLPIEPGWKLRPKQNPGNADLLPLILMGSEEPVPPPPQIEPAQPNRPKKPVDLAIYADPAQIGSDILFMRDPPEAFKRAKAEKKMVFMVHLSGNLEDKECT